MSTKIYEAYRVPTGKLNNFLACVTPFIFDEAEKKIRVLMSSLKPEALENSKFSDIGDGKHKRWFIVQRLLKENHDNQYRANPFDFENEWGVRILNRFAYLMPFGNCIPRQEIILRINEVQLYHFWNNTDRDEAVAAASWWRRGETWKKVFKQPPLSFVPVSFAPGKYMATIEIERRIRG